jgi:hypothetical protein
MGTFRRHSHSSGISLLDQFLEEDATPQVRQLLRNAISALDQSKGAQTREFTFNRFNLRIDATNGVVTLEDDLDTSEAGRIEIELPVFVDAL